MFELVIFDYMTTHLIAKLFSTKYDTPHHPTTRAFSLAFSPRKMTKVDFLFPCFPLIFRQRQSDGFFPLVSFFFPSYFFLGYDLL